MLVGAGARRLAGRRIDLGIDNDFVRKVSEDLKPGCSALLLSIEDTAVATLATGLDDEDRRLLHKPVADESS